MLAYVFGFSVAGVDREDASVVGRPLNQQHASDDAASAGGVQWISQPTQAAEARGERQTGDDVQYSADKTETERATGVPPCRGSTRLCKSIIIRAVKRLSSLSLIVLIARLIFFLAR